MNTAFTEALAAIRDLYRTIQEITARVLDDFSIEALNSAVRDRALLLARIDDERRVITKATAPNLLRTSAEFQEIRNCIESITALDHEVSNRVMRRMEEIRAELISLTNSSRAANCYTRHCRL
jgi:hypothetical protein